MPPTHCWPRIRARSVIVCDDGLQHLGAASRHRDLRLRRARRGQRLAAAGRAAARTLAAAGRPGAAHRRAPAGIDGVRCGAAPGRPCARAPTAQRVPLAALAGPAAHGHCRHRPAGGLLRDAAGRRACTLAKTHRAAGPSRLPRRRRSPRAAPSWSAPRRTPSSSGGCARTPGPCRWSWTIDPAFWAALDRLLDAKLSSAHGPQTS